MSKKNISVEKTTKGYSISHNQLRYTLDNRVIFFISVIVLAFYIWIAGTNGVPLIVGVGPEFHEKIRTPCLFPDISPHHYGFYNLMADAFEAGRMDLLIDPPHELINLSNPRNTIDNQYTRILDLSFYKKRFYLYFGAVPTLTLFIPFRWLGIGSISEPLAVVIFCYGLYLCSLYILLKCVHRFIPNANRGLITISILALAISNAAPYNLRHPVVYEVAICSGAFFTMLGVAFFVKAVLDSILKFRWLILGSFAIGLSIGCRPIYIFSALFIFFFWIALIFSYRFNLLRSLKAGISLALPFSILVVAVMCYNYIRFGSYSEFGMTFMLNATEWNLSYMNRLCNVPPGLFLTLLCPPNLNAVFPFIRLQQFYPFDLPVGYAFDNEFSGGILVTTPIIVAAIFIGFSSFRKKIFNKEVCISIFLVGFGFTIILIEAYMMFSNTMRYQMDYAPFILLGSCVMCLNYQSQIKNHLTKTFIKYGMIFCIVYGVVSHVAFGLTGLRDTFRRGNPIQYFALEDFFRPVSVVLTSIFGSDQTKISDITIPNGSARFEDGTEGPWVGEKGFYVRFTAEQTIPMQFSADVVVRPDLPGDLKLEFQNPTGSLKSSVVKAISRQTFQFTLHPGSNRISIFATSNSPLLKDQDKHRLAALKNIQISPVAR